MADEIVDEDTARLICEGLSCGCSGGAWLPCLLELLRKFDENYRVGGQSEPFGSWAPRLLPPDPWTYMPLAFMDAKGFIEHGISIRCSWLTPLGKAVLAWLEKYGTDVDKWPDGFEEIAVPK